MAALAAAVLLAVAAIVAAVVYVRRWQTTRGELRRVRATFERYVPKAVVDAILEKGDERIFTGREMRTTILVCRIWNFSLLVEDLSPEQTLQYLNEFYAIAGTSIQKHRGIVTQFSSDGIVGVFGAPLEDPVQEDNATRAAIDIVRLFSAMEQRWNAQGRTAIRAGIGIASGTAIAGDAGFRQRREYAVVGPAVHLAHRLQETTNDLNASILVSAATAHALGDDYQLVHVRDYPVTGLRRMVDAYIVRSRRGTERPLDFPPPQQFARTVVTPPEPPEQPRREYIAPDVRDDAALRERPAADVPPERLRKIVATESARPRALPIDARLAELYFPEIDTGRVAPEYPLPPPPRATYEDDAGPPLPL